MLGCLPLGMDPQSITVIPTLPIGFEIPQEEYIEASQDKSPIACLSEELLTLILDMVRDLLDGPGDTVRVTRAKLPIIASHVSKFWRFVALANPLWWSTIVVKPPWKTGAVEAYLQRSKLCLLTISISSKVEHGKTDLLPSREDHQRLLALLFPQLPRCRALEIRKVFNQENENPLPSLERLHALDMPHLQEFIFEERASHYLYSPPRPLFSSAPLLRDLRLIGVGVEQFCIPQRPSSLTNNTPSLTSLHLSRPSKNHQTTFSELKSVLDTCLSLTTLAIYHDVLTKWPGRTSTCNVPSLESLYFLDDMFTVSELLLFLSAPKLKELTIAPVATNDLRLLVSESQQEKSLNPHHSRFPVLRTLTLAPNYPKAYKVIPKASLCFPQIEHLILPNLFLSSFIKYFTREVVFQTVLFPNLLDLALTGVDMTFARAIRNMKVFRAEQHFPLRTVFVDTASWERMHIVSSVSEDQDIHPGLDVVEANLWEAQRERLLYTDVEALFAVSQAYR